MKITSVLVGAASLLSAATAASSLPRGVGPEFAKYYTSKDRFACINHPEIKLNPKQINDKHCNCPDGSDEPGTAACAHLDVLSPSQPLHGDIHQSTATNNALLGFWCENKGHIGAYVPFIYVNDGVCDYDLCCDGSEEWLGKGGVKCPNKCGEIGKEHRKKVAEKQAALDRALKKKETLVAEAQRLRLDVDERIIRLQKEIQELEAKRNDLQKKHEEVEKTERGRISRGPVKSSKLGILVNLAKERISGLKNTLDNVLYQRDATALKVKKLEDILRKFKEEYNPNFNDEGVKAAVKSWEDYTANQAQNNPEQMSDAEINSLLSDDNEYNGINWAEFEEAEPVDADIIFSFETYLSPSLRTAIREKILTVRLWLINNGLMAEPKNTDESGTVKAAREAYEAADHEVSKKAHELEKLQQDLNGNYGPNDIFRGLKDKCITIPSGEYDYELCWMGKTYQKSKKGHGQSHLGTFDTFSWQDVDEEEKADGKGLGTGKRLVLKYENGQGCWNGPNRRTDVWLACHETEKIWKVMEAEKCVYKMEVGTPAVCEGRVAMAPAGKDEL